MVDGNVVNLGERVKFIRYLILLLSVKQLSLQNCLKRKEMAHSVFPPYRKVLQSALFFIWFVFFLHRFFREIGNVKYNFEICPEMIEVTTMAKIRQIRQAKNALTDLTKIRPSRRADFALMNLTKIRQNRQFHEHLLDLTKFRQICHFRYYVHFWTQMKIRLFVPF